MFSRLPSVQILSGGVAAQGVQLLAYPVIARWITPDQFGIYFAVVGVVTVVVTLATLQLESAILASRARYTDLILNAAFHSLCCVGLLCGLVLLTVATPHPLSGGYFTIGIAYLPIGIFLHGLYALAVAKTVRSQRYHKIGRAHLTLALATAIAQISVGFAEAGLAGLLVADAAARIAALTQLSLPPMTLSRTNAFRAWRICRRLRQYPLLLGPAAALNIASQNLQSVAFPALFGASQAGQLGMAGRLLIGPVSLMTNALNQVFSGQVSAASGSPAEQARLVLQTLYASTAAALIILSAVFFGASLIFEFLLGDTWAMAGRYAMLLSWGTAASLIVSPISSIIVVKHSLPTAIAFSLAELAIRGSPFAVAYAIGGVTPAQTILMLTVGNVALYGFGLIRLLRLVGLTLADYLRYTSKLIIFFFISITPASALWLLYSQKLGIAASLIGLALFSAYAYRSFSRNWA